MKILTDAIPRCCAAVLCVGLWGAQNSSMEAGEPTLGSGRTYAIRYVDSPRTIKTAVGLHKDSFNMYAQHLLDALVQRLGDRGFRRVDSLSGTCCKISIELLDILPAERGLWRGVDVIATVGVTGADARPVYFDSYRGETKSKGGGGKEIIERAGDDLADNVMKDAEFIRILSATTDAAGAKAAALASVTVSSVPGDADIEISGAFTGNTPSTVKLEPGKYHIVVKKEGYAWWERTLEVTAGSAIRMNAELTVSGTKPAPDAQFDQASTFANGLGSVVRGGKRSLIDATGATRWTSD